MPTRSPGGLPRLNRLPTQSLMSSREETTTAVRRRAAARNTPRSTGAVFGGGGGGAQPVMTTAPQPATINMPFQRIRTEAKQSRGRSSRDFFPITEYGR